MPAKQQSEGEFEQGPRKRAPKPKTQDDVIRPATSADLSPDADMATRIDRLQDSIDVLNDDMSNGFDNFGKAVAVVLEGQGKNAASGNAQLIAMLTRMSERVDLQCDRFDALLAALAICDRLPSRRFDQLMREVRKMAAKLSEEQPKPAAKPVAEWLVWTLWIGGMVLFALAMVGIFALMGVGF
jgi:hypothetical protein